MPHDLDRTLSERFGLEALRPWQREAIEALLEGPRRCLVIAPTGGGKSLCYQLPATILEGTSVVVSPLIALMEDQVQRLTERGVPATYLASTLDPAERRAREQGVAEGRYRLLYLAPERLAAPGTLERLVRLRPPLVAIDEAHCISQWGHDFRPDYLRLGEALRLVRPERVLACTATATVTVRQEILDRLGLDRDQTRVVLNGFARPNLHLSAIDVDGARQKRALTARAITDALGAPRAPQGAAIVYAGTRKATEEVAAELRKGGYRVAAYHAGLPPEERSRVSESFAARTVDVVVATNAFGMGVDRPDVRCVVHLQPPGSIEAYYQEVGRAGRDGQPAVGMLLSGASDMALRRRLIEYGGRDGEAPSEAEVARQWALFLELMRYVEAGSCRHDFILRHFGDEAEMLGGCGHCDVCERIEQGEEPGVGPEDAIVVQKALAGVARADRHAGMLAIADMLHGADDERQRRLGLRNLSTWGILRDRPAPWIVALLRRLVTAGLLGITAGDFPMPYLTPAGGRVMRGLDPVRVLLPPPVRKRAPRPRAAAAERIERTGALTADQESAFERLRATRLALARAQRVPPYVVCHDRVLAEIARARPRSLAELGGVKGMGPMRVATYGRQFLQAIDDAP